MTKDGTWTYAVETDKITMHKKSIEKAGGDGNLARHCNTSAVIRHGGLQGGALVDQKTFPLNKKQKNHLRKQQRDKASVLGGAKKGKAYKAPHTWEGDPNVEWSPAWCALQWGGRDEVPYKDGVPIPHPSSITTEKRAGTLSFHNDTV